MKILFTNDDGVASPGLAFLRDRFRRDHETIVVAPIRERSACSHSIALENDLHLEIRDDNVYALDSTPADCVRLACLGLLNDPIDAVISGINRGANAGYDVHYSGTVAGAREGVIQGKPSLAFSLYGHKTDGDFVFASAIAESLIRFIFKGAYDGAARGVFLNINIPNTASVKGLKITRVGKRRYRDAVEICDRSRREGAAKIARFYGDVPEGIIEEGNEFHALKDGYVSATALSLSCETGNENLRFLEEWRYDG